MIFEGLSIVNFEFILQSINISDTSIKKKSSMPKKVKLLLRGLVFIETDEGTSLVKFVFRLKGKFVHKA